MSSAEDREHAETRDVWVDPVSHQPVDRQSAGHKSFYAGHLYHFVSQVNKQTFEEDPQLWIPTAHGSQTSATLSSIGEAQ